MRILVILAVLAVGLGALWAWYASDMAATRDRLAASSEIVETALGPVEAATWGEGPPALVIHGAGGGWDQGRVLAETLGGEGLRWIAVSRPGYLRTPLGADPSPARQADLFAALLDSLGVESVVVLAVSGGVPPALKLADRHPERVAGLALVSSAPFSPFTLHDLDRAMPDWVVTALFLTDFPAWAISKVAPGLLDPIFDVKPGVRERLAAEDLAFVARMLEAFLPVTDRVAGVGTEIAAIEPGAVYRLDEITAPTLVVHARDDGLNPFSVAERLAAGIEGAEIIRFETGGHLLLGHAGEVREAFRARFPPGGRGP